MDLRINIGVSGGAVPLNAAVTVTGEAAVEAPDVVIPANAVDYEVDLAWLIAGQRLNWLSCDKDVTVKTNSNSAPVNTVPLAANKPHLWWYGSGLASLFTGNVTKLYVTNANAAAANLDVYVLSDATPGG